jgi:hypothetical protein
MDGYRSSLQGIRIIVHRTAASLLLCYVDHHDKTYQWAQRRRARRWPQARSSGILPGLRNLNLRPKAVEEVVPTYIRRPD